MSVTNEVELISRLRSRDEGALELFAKLYTPRISHLAMQLMRNREDAEEVVQEVLLKVHLKIHAFREDAALWSWVYRITYNTAMHRLRYSSVIRQARHADTVPMRPGLDDHASGLPTRATNWAQGADAPVIRQFLQQTITTAIRDLPIKYRTAVLLLDVKGLTVEEASQQLGLKTQALKTRLHRGRVILRERLRDIREGVASQRPAPAFC